MQLVRIASTISTTDDSDSISALELDSHAYSPVVGKKAFIIRKTGKRVNVSGFTNRLGMPIPVDVVDAALYHDCEYTGKTYLMIIRNALYLQEMTVTLIPPIMMRLAGIEINECPKFLAKTPSIEHHSIYFPAHELRIPLQMYGIISYLPMRCPSKAEFDNPTEDILELTPQVKEWNPHDDKYQQQESSMLNFRGEIKERSAKKFIISSYIERSLEPSAFCFDLTQRACESEFSSHKVYALKTANGSTSTLNPSHL